MKPLLKNSGTEKLHENAGQVKILQKRPFLSQRGTPSGEAQRHEKNRDRMQRYASWSSEEGHRADALAPGAEEGRDKLR